MTAAEIFLEKVAGNAINWVLNFTILPLLIHTTISVTEATAVTVVYTVVAVIRSAVTRRLFEHLRSKGIN
jgi:hypothetical protein